MFVQQYEQDILDAVTAMKDISGEKDSKYGNLLILFT